MLSKAWWKGGGGVVDRDVGIAEQVAQGPEGGGADEDEVLAGEQDGVVAACAEVLDRASAR